MHTTASFSAREPPLMTEDPTTATSRSPQRTLTAEDVESTDARAQQGAHRPVASTEAPREK
jgi:hypothetical protein